MTQSADDPRPGAGAPETAIVCDTNAFNLRFLRAAMQKLGFGDVVESRNVDDLVAEATTRQPTVVVFDPAMQNAAGVDALEQLQQRAPRALLVAFCSDDELSRTIKAMGIVTVEKASILKLDALIATIQVKLGRTLAEQPEDIPVADMETPVWDLVPSLANPDPAPTAPEIGYGSWLRGRGCRR